MLFGIPRAPTAAAAEHAAPLLTDAFARYSRDGLAVSVVVLDNYGALGSAVASGAVAAAWAPPIVCARVELSGGALLARCARAGVTTYRSALVCRTNDTPDLAAPERLRAVWVDEDSAGGYLLARAWLQNRRVDALTSFQSARFVGSYAEALAAVARGDADLCAMYSSSAHAGDAPVRSALDELTDLPAETRAALQSALRVFAYTADTHTDGIVVGHDVSEPQRAALLGTLMAMAHAPEGRSILRAAFRADTLVPSAARRPALALKSLMRAPPPIAATLPSAAQAPRAVAS